MMVSTSSLNVLDRPLVERIAAGLLTSPGLVEKDWHVTRALGVLARFDHGAAVPAFGGGTSLSKGWGLIKRFSEDIDFKVAMPVAASRSKARNERSDYRERILTALTEAEFTLDGEPVKRDESQFFSVNLFYPSLFVAGPGLRPHLRVVMTSPGFVQCGTGEQRVHQARLSVRLYVPALEPLSGTCRRGESTRARQIEDSGGPLGVQITPYHSHRPGKKRRPHMTNHIPAELPDRTRIGTIPTSPVPDGIEVSAVVFPDQAMANRWPGFRADPPT
jgi:hypothetical protein